MAVPELLAANVPVTCLETRHAKAALRAQNMKTDRNDARGLAQIMRTGWYKAVHIKNPMNQKLRMLLKTRRWVVDKRIDLENHIRGTLKVFGFKLGKVTTVTFESHVHSLMTADMELQTCLETLLHVREQFLKQYHTLDRTIRKAVKADAVCQRLMTVPGVGPLTALLFRTTIDCPARFAKSRDVGVHLGLTPRKYASGEVNYDGRITKCGDAMIRHHLYEAALVMLTRGNRWHPLKAWGLRLAKRSSMKNAFVAVARKLAILLHRLWVDGTTFRWTTLHGLLLDGVYRLTDRGPVFQAVPAPTAAQLQTLLARMIQRLMKGLTRQGALMEEQGIPLPSRPRWRSHLGPPARGGLHLPHCARASSRPKSPDVERPVVAPGKPRSAAIPGLCQCPRVQAAETRTAVSLHHPPPLGHKRLRRTPAGEVVLQLKTPYRDGTTHLVMTPLEFLQRLAALVPRPRLHLIRFHGVLAPNAAWRPQIVPGDRDQAPATTVETSELPTASTRARLSWAQLLKRVFAIDLTTCPQCGGPLTLIAAIEEPAVIAKILAHLGLPTRAPPRAAARLDEQKK